MRLLTAAAERLQRRPSLLVAVGVVLLLPTLRWGFLYDDYVQVQVLAGGEAGGPLGDATPWNLFRFMVGDPVVTGKRIHDGILPWWTESRIRLAFFRPLSSATHVMDHAVWG